MKRTPINKVSEKQKRRNKEWADITDRVCEELQYICQYCGKKGQRSNSWRFDYLDGHHILLKSRGGIDAKENCYIAHRLCHQYIHGHNVIVSLGDYKNRELWL